MEYLCCVAVSKRPLAVFGCFLHSGTFNNPAQFHFESSSIWKCSNVFSGVLEIPDIFFFFFFFFLGGGGVNGIC